MIITFTLINIFLVLIIIIIQVLLRYSREVHGLTSKLLGEGVSLQYLLRDGKAKDPQLPAVSGHCDQPGVVGDSHLLPTLEEDDLWVV